MHLLNDKLDYRLFFLSLLKKEKNAVFFDTQRTDNENYRSFLFLKPAAVVKARSGGAVMEALWKIEKFVDSGYYAVGYLTYEAGLFFEELLATNRKFNFPLLWFGIYEEPLIFNHKTQKFEGDIKYLNLTKKEFGFDKLNPYIHNDGHYKIINPNFSLAAKPYSHRIDKIKRHIEKGDTYQVNFSFKYKFNFCGSPEKLFLDLSLKQPVPYGAFIKHDSLTILSFSPELFFRKNGCMLTVKPMKGTMSRGLNVTDDHLKSSALARSPKTKAENIMIVDLLRNDLGKISETDTVKPRKIFEVEKHKTLFQMTSTIKSKLKKEVTLTDIFANLFPSGSVTGAPKIRTMQIIEELEKEPRKIYTGAIGFITSHKDCAFNVAIRTIVIDKKQKTGEMGIGSGIVYDSDVRSEYSECKLKADFLVKKEPVFSLIETMLWKDGIALLPLHLRRLGDSAEYFGFPFDRKKILKALRAETSCFEKGKSYKLRFLLDEKGEAKIESFLLEPQEDKVLSIVLSDKKINSQNPLLYHKTTSRKLYNKEYSKCLKKGFDEVIFTNENGQITEGAISNIIIKRDNVFYTPPLSCGLLNGVYRQFLFKKKMGLKEKILYKKDLLTADEIYLTNAVMGMRKVILVNRCPTGNWT